MLLIIPLLCAQLIKGKHDMTAIFSMKKTALIIKIAFIRHLLRHHKAKPSPEYGSRQRATTREGYSSHCSLIARQRNDAAECDIYEHIKQHNFSYSKATAAHVGTHITKLISL